MNRPTLQTLSARIQSDLASHLGLMLPLKKNSILSALSLALGGAVHLLYGHLEAIQTQLSMDTATGVSLDRLAFPFGIRRRGKTPAQGLIRVSGTPGIIIPKGTLFSTSDGRTYSALSSFTIGPQSFIWGEVVAGSDGKKGNVAQGEMLTLINSIAGIDSKSKVLEKGIAGGFEEEDDDQLRSRLFHFLRHPGQGGTEADYIRWAQEVPGVGEVKVSHDPHSYTVFVSFLTIDKEAPLPSEHLSRKVVAHLVSLKPLGTRVIVSPGGIA